MATLTTQQREEIFQLFMEYFDGETSLLKSQLKTALNETDSWIDTNQASYKTSLSEPARSGLTTKQLVQLFVFVAQKRYEVT